MTRFLDGPAAGVLLSLRRAPLFLRAVQGPGGEWDALDLLDDAPGPAERVVVYRRASGVSTVHLDLRDKSGRRRGEWYRAADYAVLAEQPAEGHTREADAWRAWCRSQVAPNPPKE